MKILMVNNQLSIIGGTETYMFSLGDELVHKGHQVEYFGLEDPKHLHGNSFNLYANKPITPFGFVSNKKNVRLFAQMLDYYKPNVIHMNLVYFTLTEDVVYEAKKRNISIIQTIHDSKIVCPCHRFYVEHEGRNCRECLPDLDFSKCIKNKCIKGSLLKSILAVKEANYYKKKNTYALVDKYIFVSKFMEEQHIGHGVTKDQSIVLQNFSRIEKRTAISQSDDKYVVYFGRLGREKGIETLAKVCKKTPEIKYKIIGTGEMEYLFSGITNCELLGFKSGIELENIVSGAICSVLPSICYENCPMTVLESIALGTPVIGSNIGGIPELIINGKTGFIFESGNAIQLEESIRSLYDSELLANKMKGNCLKESRILDVHEYTDILIGIYEAVANSHS